MTTKAEYTEQWSAYSPEMRRARLDELGSIDSEVKTTEQTREHDVLASLVAADEAEKPRSLPKLSVYDSLPGIPDSATEPSDYIGRF
jgi:hypothetical protein